MVKCVSSPRYIYIETKKEEKKKRGNNRLAFLHKTGIRRLYSKLPLKVEPLNLLDVEGKKITLPFTLSDLKEMKKEKITDMLNRIIIGEGTQNIVVEKSLDAYVDPSLFIDGKMIPFLCLDEILRMIRKIHRIPEKEMKLKVIDSNSVDLREVLSTVIADLNYLTVITERVEELESFAEKIYNETGLLILIKSKDSLNIIMENEDKTNTDTEVILDLSDECMKNIYCLERDSVYIDLCSDMVKLKTILAKRKDISYYNFFQFTLADEDVDNRILQAVLCGNATWISKGNMEGLTKDVKRYPIHLKKAGITLDF